MENIRRFHTGFETKQRFLEIIKTEDELTEFEESYKLMTPESNLKKCRCNDFNKSS